MASTEPCTSPLMIKLSSLLVPCLNCRCKSSSVTGPARVQLFIAGCRGALAGNLPGGLFILDDFQPVARSRDTAQAEDNNRRGGRGGFDALPPVIQHGLDAAEGRCRRRWNRPS